ncbi:MAG: zinc ribbon domain-containing protein [Kiritimatiellaeota bacterium]|nr:zinc ribbon domain-containing protein [Kiritimatiellota bacterium]
MPIYEYTCGDCGTAFEHLARTLSDKPEKCPSCGRQKKLVKLLSAFAPASATPSLPSGCRGCAGAPHCAASANGGCGMM